MRSHRISCDQTWLQRINKHRGRLVSSASRPVCIAVQQARKRIRHLLLLFSSWRWVQFCLCSLPCSWAVASDWWLFPVISSHLMLSFSLQGQSDQEFETALTQQKNDTPYLIPHISRLLGALNHPPITGSNWVIDRTWHCLMCCLRLFNFSSCLCPNMKRWNEFQIRVVKKN